MADSGRNFTTAMHEALMRDEKDALHYTIDGKPLVIYPPSAEQMTMLMAATMNFDEDDESLDPAIVGTIIQTFIGMLDEKSVRMVRRRLLDPGDTFTLETIVEIVAAMAEDITARPTELSADSSPSRPATGKSSTAISRSKGSTRSRSVRAVSST